MMLARTDTLSVWEKGARKFDWWPDWRGQTVAIVASGPSLRGADLNALRGRVKVVAIKKSVELVPWADAVYGCDAPWWKHVLGLPKFSGLKLAWDGGACTEYPDLKRVEIRDKFSDRLKFDEPLSVGAGGNSGFQALNLVVQFGAARVLLFGFDAQDASGPHWYGRNNWNMCRNPDESCFKRWRAAFQTAAGQLKMMGVEAVNCSPYSTIKAFPHVPMDKALA